MTKDLNPTTSAIDIAGWKIPEDRNHATSISIIDMKGKVVARVPRRPDDLNIALLVRQAPEMLDLLHRIRNDTLAGNTVKEMINKFFSKGNLQ